MTSNARATWLNPASAEWAGCCSGLIGAGVLALNTTFSGWGFVLFLLSNFFWIAYGYMTKTKSLVLMQAGFTLTSVVGIWNWIGK